MRDAILILDDDESRIACIVKQLPRIAPELHAVTWNNAHAMIREVGRYLDVARVISLDHDLYVAEDEADDPGDGLDVAKHLATLPPACPVVVHSSNSDRARMMVGEFELAGWRCERVAPLGSDWIEHDWTIVVSELAEQ